MTADLRRPHAHTDSDVKTEIQRRQANTAEVLAIFTKREGQWIHWRRFFAIAPLAWRTRISNARKIVKAAGGVIEWNGNTKRSAYRYLPYQPLGRDAGRVVDRAAPLPLFPENESGWQRKHERTI